MRLLREQGAPLLGDLDFTDTLHLFRGHFLLFHVLYRLADQLGREGGWRLDISPLTIQLVAAHGCGAMLPMQRDGLRDYYLDMGQLETTTSADVRAMLAGAWTRLHAVSEVGKALEVLGLREPADAATIRRSYRRMAMRAHPDRGGSTQCLQALNAALATLKAAGRVA